MSNKFNKEKLRGFYADLTSYILLSFLLLILGTFIGSYMLLFIVVIVWGAVLIVQANNVGFIFKPGKTLSILQKSQFLKNSLPFLNDDWDGEKIIGDNIEKDVKRAEKTIVRKAEKFVKVAEDDLEKALKKVEKKTKSKSKKGAVKKAERFVETIAEDIEKSLKKAEKKIKTTKISKKAAPQKAKATAVTKKKTVSASKTVKTAKAAAKPKSKSAVPTKKKVAKKAPAKKK